MLRLEIRPSQSKGWSMPCARKYHRLRDASSSTDPGHRKTDDVLRKTHSGWSAGPPETHRVLPSSDSEELLQDWAKKRGPPNALEVDMLSQYIGVDVWVIYDWCQSTEMQQPRAWLTTSQSRPGASRHGASI